MKRASAVFAEVREKLARRAEEPAWFDGALYATEKLLGMRPEKPSDPPSLARVSGVLHPLRHANEGHGD
jgi:hypothetical protein